MDRLSVKRLVESTAFQTFIFAVIAVNAITIGVETKPPSEEAANALEVFDYICLGIYVVEAALKLYAYGKDYFKDRWNVFDFIIIVLSLWPTRFVPMPVQLARTVRLFRVVRVFRIVSLFKQMRIIVESLAHSIPGVLWTFALLMVIIYVFDVAGVFLFGDRCPDYFGDLPTGLWSLFQIVTLEAWPDIASGVMGQYPEAWLYFVPFVIIASFIMLNIVLGIILDTVEESRQAGRVEEGKTEVQLARELDELKKQIETVQRLLDKSNNEMSKR